jgi:hypothetical protein
MKYGIVTTYLVSFENAVDLGDRTWDDVEGWYVKSSTLYLKFKDSETIREVALFEYITNDVVEWKRPTKTQIFTRYASENINWTNEIDSRNA